VLNGDLRPSGGVFDGTHAPHSQRVSSPLTAG
jgi:hypothetical protein